MGKEVVGSMSKWSGVLKDMFRQFGDGSLTLNQTTAFVDHKDPFKAGFSALIQDWQKFYKKIFNLKVDFSRVPVPEAPDEFSWLVCVPKMTTEQAFRYGKKQFPNWKETDKSLDDVLDLSFGRDARQYPYIIRLCANVEADKDLRNLSADDIVAQKIDTATLKQRLLLGRFLHWKEGLFLDEKNTTLCSGSRYTNGSVPSVLCRDGELGVIPSNSDRRLDSLRPRRVVS